jgi:hypothetical protein
MLSLATNGASKQAPALHLHPGDQAEIYKRAGRKIAMVLENPEPPASHKRSGVHWLDLSVSVCALITSAVSIFMAYQNSNAMEDLVHANSWPFVQLSSGNAESDSDQTLVFNLNNAGTGPARIYRFEFVVDDQPIDGANLFVNIARACCESELETTIEDVAQPFDAIGAIQTRRITTTMLAAGEQTPALRWPRTEANAPLWDAVDRARQSGRLATRACYCSVFDECWDARSNMLPVRREQICEAPPPNASVNN